MSQVSPVEVSPPELVRGIGVSPGRVLGPAVFAAAPIVEPPAGLRISPDADPAAEVARLAQACEAVAADLTELAKQATADAQDVLNATAVMATDPTLLEDASERIIVSHLVAERAIWEAADAVAAQFRDIGGYLAERVSDLFDVRNRVIAKLSGRGTPGLPTWPVPFVLVAEDLPPAATTELDPSQVLAIVTASGGATSHTAIIARSMGIVAVVGASGIMERLRNGEQVLVDGGQGTVTLNPPARGDGPLTAPFQAVRDFNGSCVLSDGHEVELLANVGDPRDAKFAARLGARGVGLFRTEFCFLERTEPPTVDQQAKAYRKVFSRFPEGKVVIRTLDAGSDKPLPFLNSGREFNPALGLRGHRALMQHPKILHDQLTAISQAAADSSATVWVMAPMVSTPAEAREFVELAHSFGLPVAGVMVEVPSLAIQAEAALSEVAFASIGTNDLAQYVMAADRMEGTMAWLTDPWQPALLNLVRHTAQAGVKSQVPVGVCGEAASYPDLAAVLVGLGVTSLSMSARALPDVAALLTTLTREDCERLSDLAANASDAVAARAAVRDALPQLADLGL